MLLFSASVICRYSLGFFPYKLAKNFPGKVLHESLYDKILSL
jgi:hypothetical protein